MAWDGRVSEFFFFWFDERPQGMWTRRLYDADTHDGHAPLTPNALSRCFALLSSPTSPSIFTPINAVRPHK